MSISRTTHHPEETFNLAKAFAKNLKPGDIVCLQGDLGAGKTVFVKGVAKALGINPDSVSSPTFVLMNHYKGKRPLYHFDLYRIEKEDELKTIHFDEFFYGDGISLIEWSKRLKQWEPKECWHVDILHAGDNQRDICISYPSNPQRTILL